MALPLQAGMRDPRPGEPDVADLQRRLQAKGFSVGRAGADGIFGPSTLAAVRRFQRKAGLTADGIVGPKTWHWLTYTKNAPRTVQSDAPTGRQLATLAYKIATGGFRGGRNPRYVFGAENNVFHPELVAATDCSELVQVSVSTLAGQVWIDGSRFQYAGSRRIPVARAIGTPGALLFHTSNGSIAGIHHVAVSLGDGRTAEARNRLAGCGIWTAHGRFNLAALAPPLRY